MYHCDEHNRDHNAYDCPDCVAVKRHIEILEDAQESREQAKALHTKEQERLAEQEDKRQNPGEYECPGCGARGLNRGAIICQKCTHPLRSFTDPTSYWNAVYQREAAAAKAAADRAELWAEENRIKNAAAETKASLLRQKAADEQRLDDRARGCFFVLFLVIGGIVAAVNWPQLVAAYHNSMANAQTMTIRPAASAPRDTPPNTNDGPQQQPNVSIAFLIYRPEYSTDTLRIDGRLSQGGAHEALIVGSHDIEIHRAGCGTFFSRIEMSTPSDFEVFPRFVCRELNDTSGSPGPLHHDRACPFEGCFYGVWKVSSRVALHAEPDTASSVVATLQTGDSVQVVDGFVETRRPALFVVGVDTTLRAESLSEDGELRLRRGDTIWVYTPYGEGAYRVYVQGKFRTILLNFPGDLLTSDVREWWVRVQFSDGAFGWTNDVDKFGGNNRFSEATSHDSLAFASVPNRLAN